MIKKLEDFNIYVAIVGFRNVKIIDVNGFFNLVRKRVKGADIQFFDGTLIAGWEHLYFATLNALNAFKNKQNISKRLTVEVLLFASAQRQIGKALEMLGIRPRTSQVAALIIAENRQEVSEGLEVISKTVSGERDDSIIKLTEGKIEEIKRLFNISDGELKAKLRKDGLEREALIDLVIEHGALLATQR